MTHNIAGQYAEVLEATRYFPSISLIMPFESKINLETEMAHKLKVASDRIENELEKNFPEDQVKPVLKKFRQVISELKLEPDKKTVAIFVSPLIQKVYYLDQPIEEKIIIDDSFEVRDLIYSKKNINRYVLAILSGRETKVFLNNGGEFIPLALNVPDHVEAYRNDMNEKTANFSDQQEQKEIVFDKFLRHTDNGLAAILQELGLPVFIMGTDKTIGHFKTITHNVKSVIAYIPGNYEETAFPELHKILEPYIAEWKIIKQLRLLKMVDEAMSQKKLAVGIKEVWKAASEKRGRLLVVEKNFVYPAQHGANPDVIYGYDETINSAFYIKDAVDDVIQKVLSSGGDVEFVEEGVLQEYLKIVLIEYYGG